MKMHAHLVKALLVFSMLGQVLQASAACDEAQNRAAAHLFFKAIDQGLLVGLPDQQGIEKLRPYITTHLRVMLEKASQANRKHFEETKGQEAPLLDGPLVVGIAEGYSNFYVSNAVKGREKSQVYVLFQFLNIDFITPNPPYVINEWRGRVEVKQEGQKCLVNNVYHHFRNDRPNLIHILSHVPDRAQ